jgi:anti-anti-sigma factor
MANYTIERKPKLCRVTLGKDLVASLVPELQAALKQELQEDGMEVVFDLGQAAMLDSSGIGLLIAAYNTVSRRQGRLHVVNVSGDVFQLLQTMRLVSRLNVVGRTIP